MKMRFLTTFTTSLHFCVGLAVALTAVAPAAMAQVVVEDVVLNFPSNAPLIKTFPIGNADPTKKLFIEAEVLKYNYENEKLEETAEVLVIPERLMLDPRKSQNIRVLIKKRPENEEAVYRVRFNPINKTINNGKVTTISGQLDVFTGLGIILTAQPKELNESYTADWNETGLNITNTGNTNLIFRQAEQCIENMDCQVDGIRLWPGKSWQLNMPKSLHSNDIQLEMRSASGTQTITIEGAE